ncbi:MAG: hypothetical protein SFU56_06415 [Capsulimonadales bacterium]|nr:hypothetical protein [Capsulimonadales bacterium]
MIPNRRERLWVGVAVCGWLLFWIVGCAKEEPPKPEGGGTYYNGPMQKGGQRSPQ